MVSLSSVIDDCWAVMYGVLQSGDNAISTDNIHSAFHDKIVSSEGYPQVIIYKPIIERRKVTMSPLSLYDVPVNFLIKVFHKKAELVGQLADEVQNSVFSSTQTFSENGMKKPELTDTDGDMWLEGDKKIHLFQMNFNFRVVVS